MNSCRASGLRAPGQELPPIAHYPIPLRATHNKAGVRPPRNNHRLVPSEEFRMLGSLDEVLETLFGDLPNGEALQ
jgi:ribosome assembly protein YihI (activator of Der GTPase)